jgi:putative copper export protein
MSRKIFIAVAMLAVSNRAGAHPGHGSTEGDTLGHYLLEPLHAGAAAVVGACVLLVVWGWRRARRPGRGR